LFAGFYISFSINNNPYKQPQRFSIFEK